MLYDEMRRLCAANELSAARRLVEAAIRKRSTPDSYLLERRIDILQRQGDTESMIKGYYDLLTTEPFCLRYYRKLKTLLTGDRWQKIHADIIEALQKNSDALKCIYEEEGDMDAIYKLILANEWYALDEIMTYFKRMPEKYHESLLRRGITELKEQSERVGTRADYVNYAKLLKRFSRLPGAAPLVAELLTHIRATYPRRRAMLEVLSAL